MNEFQSMLAEVRRLEQENADLLDALKALYYTQPGNSTERCQAIAKAECAIAKAEGRAGA